MLFFVEGRDITPDHQPNDGVGADLQLIERAHQPAVAQHRDTVAERVNLVHAMRDVDDGEPFDAELADQREQPLALTRRQRGGRLVHDQDF